MIEIEAGIDMDGLKGGFHDFGFGFRFKEGFLREFPPLV